MQFLVKFLKSKWAPWLLLVLLSGLLYWSISLGRKKSKEIDRLSNNQEALLTDLQIVKDKYGKEVARVQALELSKNEFEKLFKEQTEIVEGLRLKIKRLESYIQTSVETKDSITVDVQPPIIVRDTSSVVRPFEFSDGWMALKGNLTIDGDKAIDPAKIQMSYSVTDTLDVMVYREPKKFLFIRYGIKRLDCYIYPRNPHSKVVMGSCVLMKNRKGGK